jgi:hypothetical protein
MRLHDLALACYLYSARSGFDIALNEFRRATRPRFDVMQPGHRNALLAWLNKWGCRHIAIEYHPMASRSLVKWAQNYEARLPSPRARLWEESDRRLDGATEAYGGLQRARAGLRSRGSKSWRVTFGPTAAAKALYALRPDFFPPWDDAIRKKFGYDGSAESFRHFLVRVQAEIRSLQAEAARFGIGIDEIPAALGRRESSLPKLIDEFYWVTASGEYKLPTAEELRLWARWCGDGATPSSVAT